MKVFYSYIKNIRVENKQMADSHTNCDNYLPVIGILCVDIAQSLQKVYGLEYHSYLAVSYVNYLESCGARIIPIWNNRSRYYYETIMKQINGILMPGGAIFFNKKYCSKDVTNDSYTSSKFIFDIAKELNQKGNYFPLWGTCLGFQMILTHSADEEDIRRDCKFSDYSMPVKLEADKVLEKSKLFGKIDKELKEKMSHLPFGYHFHRYCITKEDLSLFKINQQWLVLATNKDGNGMEYITFVEHKVFPFFGTQIHPERVMFENVGPDDPCHHCLDCFQLAQYFAKFFVHQCSLNDNRFADADQIFNCSIHNFPIIYTAPLKLHWQEVFLFKENEKYAKESDKLAVESN